MSLGCRVLAFEPQMRLLPAFKRSLYFNNFDANRRLALIPCALSHNRDVLTSKDHHNWGEWSLRHANTDDNVSVPSSPSEAGAETHTHNVSAVHATTLDSLLQEDVLVRTTCSLNDTSGNKRARLLFEGCFTLTASPPVIQNGCGGVRS
jgi:hypothetical protein